MIKAIAFDFDMTLVDSRIVGKKSINDMKLKNLTIKDFTEKQLWDINHLDLMKKIIEINNSNIGVEELSKFNRECMMKYYLELEVYHLETLKFLQKNKIKLGIVSNNSTAVIKKVICSGNNKNLKFDL